jgi:hypothetical protein
MISSEALQFVVKAMAEMSEAQVTFEIYTEKLIELEGGFKVAGYFQGGFPDTFAVALEHPFFLGNFIHEYCHFRQGQDEVFNIDEEAYDFDNWLLGKYYSRKRIEECVRAIQACELDCEQRVVNCVQQYNFSDFPDISEYIRLANCYIFLYNVCLERRQWMNGKPASEVVEFNDLVPGIWFDDYTISPPGFNKIASRECFVQGSKCNSTLSILKRSAGVLLSSIMSRLSLDV